MGIILKGSTTPIKFLMVLSSDGKTGATGKTVTVNFCKGTGSFAASTNSAVELSNGWYKVTPTATETDTEGDFAIECTAADCDKFRDIRQVVDMAKVGSEMTLEDLAITAAKIQTGAIESSKLASNAITASKIATDAITSAKIEAGAIGATEIADNAITAAKIAPDAIGSSELAASAINAIADQVWDEATADHLTAGTFGKAIDDMAAGSIATAQDIADAVWDELLAGHTTAGSASMLVARVGSEMTLEDGAITAAKIASNAITSTTFATDAITGTALAASAVNEIADQVWLETLADHSGTGGSTAEALSQIGSVNPAAIADAVWDESMGGHTTAGTFGKKISDLDPSNIINQVGSSTDERLVAQIGATYRYTLATDPISSNWTRVILAVKKDATMPLEDGLSDLYILVTNPADNDNDGAVYVNSNEATSEQRLQASLAVDQPNDEVAIEIDEEITQLIDEGTHKVAIKVEWTNGADSDETIVHAGDFVFERHASKNVIE